jgi:hypothetical protein
MDRRAGRRSSFFCWRNGASAAACKRRWAARRAIGIIRSTRIREQGTTHDGDHFSHSSVAESSDGSAGENAEG